MAVEFNSFLGGLTNSIYSVVGLNHIFSSVLYTSIVLSVLVVLLIIMLYPCKKGTPMWILFKLFLYVLMLIVVVFSIHNSFIKNDYKEKYLKSNVNNLINNIHGGHVYGEEMVKVSPQLNQSYDEHESAVYNEPNQSSALMTSSDMLDDLERKI